MLTDEQIHEMTAGYITTALWADAEPVCTCEGGEGAHDRFGASSGCPADESGGLDGLTVHAEDYVYVFELCRLFAEQAGDTLTVFATYREHNPAEGTVWHHVGHDLRLNSGGHGTGFWDRDPALDRMMATTVPDEIKAFESACDRLADLAHLRPFDRSGGGDVWQESETTCTFDHLALSATSAPGERWEAPALSSAQRQAWIEEGRVPTETEMEEV